MDRAGADFFNVVSEMKLKLGANPMPLQIPIGAEEKFTGVVDLIEMKAIVWPESVTEIGQFEFQEIPKDLIDVVNEWREKLMEACAEHDEELMERYFEAPETITIDELKAVVRKATIAGTIIPVFCGSSFKNKGVQRMLDAVCAYLSSPLDKGDLIGRSVDDPDEKIFRKPDVDEPTSALAFKIATDPYVGRLTFVRVYSGKLESGSFYLNPRTRKKERISRIYQMHSNKQQPRDVIEAGDICAVVGLKDTRTGDTLCDMSKPVVMESMTFPEPVIGIAVEPKTQRDLDKLGIGLSKLAEEDPTFRVNTDFETGQTIIRGDRKSVV